MDNFYFFVLTGDASKQQEQQQRRLQTTGVPAGVVLSESTISVAEDGTYGTYTIVLDADPNTTLNVDLLNHATSEMSASATSLEFTSANWDTAQTVTVTAVDDDKAEALTELAITHSVDIPDADYVWTGAFSPSENVTVRVYDNDEAGILVSASTVYVDEGNIATYTVELMGSPSENVEVI